MDVNGGIDPDDVGGNLFKRGKGSEIHLDRRQELLGHGGEE